MSPPTVPDFTELGARKLAELQANGYRITGVCFERQVEGTQPQRGFVDFAGFVGWHQPSAAPMTAIRKAALELYAPPFRHEHGYIRDANHMMVADDAGSEGSGLIASRIRGWGRIQYMDKPEQRAAALQDEVSEVVASALNAYWAAHGITAHGVADMKGGQDGEA